MDRTHPAVRANYFTESMESWKGHGQKIKNKPTMEETGLGKRRFLLQWWPPYIGGQKLNQKRTAYHVNKCALAKAIEGESVFTLHEAPSVDYDGAKGMHSEEEASLRYTN